MKQRRKRGLAWLLAAVLLASACPAAPSRAVTEDGKICIVLDAGHGGTDSGTTQNVDGLAVREKDCTLKVAQYTKEILEEDGRFEVYLTRDSDTALSLGDRAVFAREQKADVLVSLHFNSASAVTAKGAEVWQSVLPAYQIGGLPANILANIGEITGLDTSRGVKARASETGNCWNTEKNWDTSNATAVKADYYGLIRNSARWGVPAIIVEHAFFTNEEDMAFLTQPEDAGLLALARADAKALIEFYTDHTHTYGAAETEYPVSCISAGRKAGHCTVCRAKKDISTVAAAADPEVHFVDSYKVIKKPTTTAEGVEQGLCHYCGKTVPRTIARLEADKKVTPPAGKTAATAKSVRQKKAVVRKAVKKGKKITVTIRKITGATGYQVKLGSNKKLTKNKKQFYTKKTKAVYKKWKKKTCYVKVRAYTVNAKGKREYSKWSKTRKAV